LHHEDGFLQKRMKIPLQSWGHLKEITVDNCRTSLQAITSGHMSNMERKKGRWIKLTKQNWCAAKKTKQNKNTSFTWDLKTIQQCFRLVAAPDTWKNKNFSFSHYTKVIPGVNPVTYPIGI
jgi:hypothetical protein